MRLFLLALSCALCPVAQASLKPLPENVVYRMYVARKFRVAEQRGSGKGLVGWVGGRGGAGFWGGGYRGSAGVTKRYFLWCCW